MPSTRAGASPKLCKLSGVAVFRCHHLLFPPRNSMGVGVGVGYQVLVTRGERSGKRGGGRGAGFGGFGEFGGKQSTTVVRGGV